MANDNVCAAAAATRDVSNASPSPFQDCSDVVHIAIFFDGTGNNKDVDEGAKKWSNPARIWRAAQLFADSQPNSYPVYISGVGTPFNGTALSPLEQMTVAVEDSALLGASGGRGGTRRLDLGRQQINDALRNALLLRAQQLGGQAARHATGGKQRGFADVNRALAKHRLIKQINVSIFGFSRGAALARAFCNEWLWECEDNRGQLLYEGYPIRFAFLGLFDTVASFGLPAGNVTNSVLAGGLTGRDLVVDDRVERCVHYIAGHELRFSFPVDLIRRNGNLAGNWLEKVYPGVHSDVGGGYEPNDQGINNNYARIPMRDMMREALMHGTRIFGYEVIEQRSSQIFAERFECKPETEASYKAYASVCNPSGSAERCIRQHMGHLYSAYGTLQRQGRESVTQRQHREGKSWALGPRAMAEELHRYEDATRQLRSVGNVAVNTAFDPSYALRKGIYAMWISPEEWQLNAWERNAPQGVVDFVNTFIHDSKVGFLYNAEPFSYFSSRGVRESERSVSGWIEANVARPVDRKVEEVADYAKEKAEQAKQAAQRAADATRRKAQEVADYAAEQAASAKAAAQRAAEAAGNAISDATKNAVDGLSSLWGKYGW